MPSKDAELLLWWCRKPENR